MATATAAKPELKKRFEQTLKSNKVADLLKPAQSSSPTPVQPDETNVKAAASRVASVARYVYYTLDGTFEKRVLGGATNATTVRTPPNPSLGCSWEDYRARMLELIRLACKEEEAKKTHDAGARLMKKCFPNLSVDDEKSKTAPDGSVVVETIAQYLVNAEVTNLTEKPLGKGAYAVVFGGGRHKTPVAVRIARATKESFLRQKEAHTYFANKKLSPKLLGSEYLESIGMAVFIMEWAGQSFKDLFAIAKRSCGNGVVEQADNPMIRFLKKEGPAALETLQTIYSDNKENNGYIHGDFNLGNVVKDPRNSSKWLVIDFDRSRPMEAGHDKKVSAVLDYYRFVGGMLKVAAHVPKTPNVETPKKRTRPADPDTASTAGTEGTARMSPASPSPSPSPGQSSGQQRIPSSNPSAMKKLRLRGGGARSSQDVRLRREINHLRMRRSHG